MLSSLISQIFLWVGVCHTRGSSSTVCYRMDNKEQVAMTACNVGGSNRGPVIDVVVEAMPVLQKVLRSALHEMTKRAMVGTFNLFGPFLAFH